MSKEGATKIKLREQIEGLEKEIESLSAQVKCYKERSNMLRGYFKVTEAELIAEKEKSRVLIERTRKFIGNMEE